MTNPVPGKAQGVFNYLRKALNNERAMFLHALGERKHEDFLATLYATDMALGFAEGLGQKGTGREPAEAPNEICRCGHSDQMHGVTFSATICSGGNCDCTMYWPVKKAEAEGRPKRPEEIYDTRALAYIEALEAYCSTLESKLAEAPKEKLS